MTKTDQAGTQSMVERVARAVCRADHPCWSIVGEIMEHPSYAPGHEGDAAFLTQAGRYRQSARAAIAEWRKPTSAMLFALSCTASKQGYLNRGAPLCFEAITDAALSEEGE